MFLPYAVEDNIERKKTELNVVLNESLNIINQSSKLVGGPVPEASKIGLGLVKIPKLEVCLACAFFI